MHLSISQRLLSISPPLSSFSLSLYLSISPSQFSISSLSSSLFLWSKFDYLFNPLSLFFAISPHINISISPSLYLCISPTLYLSIIIHLSIKINNLTSRKELLHLSLTLSISTSLSISISIVSSISISVSISWAKIVSSSAAALGVLAQT